MSATLYRAELLPGRDAKWGIGAHPKKASRSYHVLIPFGSAEFSIAAIANLPAVGSAHPAYPDLWVTEYNLKEENNGVRWIVEVIFEHTGATQTNGSYKVRVKKIGQVITEVSRDLVHALPFPSTPSPTDTVVYPTGVILNTAGQPLSSTKQISQYDPLFEIVRVENTPPSVYAGFDGTLNTKDTTLPVCKSGETAIVIPAGCCRIKIHWEATFDEDFPYEYTFFISRRYNWITNPAGTGAPVNIGWLDAFVEEGYQQLVSGVLKPIMITDAVTNLPFPASSPQKLDKDGAQLPPTQAPVIGVVNPYQIADWSALGLNIGPFVVVTP